MEYLMLKLPSSLSILIALGTAAGLLYGSYYLGNQSGKNSVQLEWEKSKKELKQEADRLIELNHQKEQAYILTIAGLNHEILKSKTDFNDSLAGIQSEYTERLQLSETRAAIYKRKAEGGAIECRGLADYAARLDSSLEEGRYVVKELSEVVRLRDREITTLSAQIKADRNLFKF